MSLFLIPAILHAIFRLGTGSSVNSEDRERERETSYLATADAAMTSSAIHVLQNSVTDDAHPLPGSVCACSFQK